MMASSGSMSGVTTASSDEWYRSNKVSTAKTLLDWYHLSEEAVVTPDMNPDEAIIEAAPPLP